MRILGLGAYVPERVMTNEEWSRHVETSDEWIFSRSGIKERRFAADDQTTVDLALPAARQALDDAGLEPASIGELIVATDTPEVYAPDTAAFLQHRLGLGEVPAYDLGGSGCAGFVLALDLARSRVASSDKKVLVVGAELISRLMDWQDRATCVLFGDGAGAAVVGRGEGGAEILAACAGTDGSKAPVLMREVGGTRLPFTPERAATRDHLRIDFNGREVFKLAVARMSAAARQVVADAGVELADVALVVPHQANERILQAVARALDLPSERVFANIRDYGNTGSASVPLALRQALDQGRIAAGDRVLLTAFGAGFHWAAALLAY